MIWVKVCGVRTPAIAEVADSSGADAIGLVLVASSPRRVSMAQAGRIGYGLRPKRVVLTEDLSPRQLMRVVEKVGADGVQPYGRDSDEAAAAAASLGLLVLRPVGSSLVTVRRSNLDHIPEGQTPLIDSGHQTAGGTGRAWDWQKVAAIEREFVLAGGLNPDNVAGAVAVARPWGVDASSGMERSRGEKDPELVEAFVKNAKSR